METHARAGNGKVVHELSDRGLTLCGAQDTFDMSVGRTVVLPLHTTGEPVSCKACLRYSTHKPAEAPVVVGSNARANYRAMIEEAVSPQAVKFWSRKLRALVKQA